MTTVPVEILLPDTRKLIIEQKGNNYFCSLFQFSTDQKTYLQIAGADGKLTLKIEDTIDSAYSFQRILSWLGEKNALALLSGMSIFSK